MLLENNVDGEYHKLCLYQPLFQLALYDFILFILWHTFAALL